MEEGRRNSDTSDRGNYRWVWNVAMAVSRLCSAGWKEQGGDHRWEEKVETKVALKKGA
jgi:hypothetical protein